MDWIWGVSLIFWAVFLPPFWTQAVLSAEDPTVPPVFRNSGSLAEKKTSPLCIYVYIYMLYQQHIYVCINIDIWLFSLIILIVWFGSEGKGYAEQLELQRYYIVCDRYMYIVHMYIYIYIVHGCGKYSCVGSDNINLTSLMILEHSYQNHQLQT